MSGLNIAGVELKPLDEDYRNRFLQFEIDCNDGAGNAYACHSAAEFHAVMDRNHSKAAEILAKNCDGKNNYAASCFKLGRLYLTGKGVEQNDALALQRFEKACALGLVPACSHVASMLMEAGVDGKPKDAPRALTLLESACASGEDPESCFKLGRRLLCPQPEIRDPPRAAVLLRSACNAQYAPACRLLAVLFKHGDTGVAADPVQFEELKRRTEDLVVQRGSAMGMQVTR